MTRGDSRIAVTLAKNKETAKLSRKNRFIIDDPESQEPLSYILSKPLKLGWSFNGEGAYKFVMQEVNSTDDDNFELYIADYYKHFPRGDGTPGTGSDDSDPGTNPSPPGGNGTSGREGWI